MANLFFYRIAFEIDNLLLLLGSRTIGLQDVVEGSSLEVPEDKLEGIKEILKNIKGLLYDSGRQIREDAIKLRLKELQDLVIEVEDFVDDYQYKMFQREAEFRSLRNKIKKLKTCAFSDPSPGLDGGARPSTIDPSSEFSEGAGHSSGLDGGARSCITDSSSGLDGGASSCITDSSSGLGGGARLHTIYASPIKVPFNIVVRVVGMKHTFDDLLAQLQKSRKFASHLLLISQEKQDSEKLQRVTEFLLAESSSLKSIKDSNYLPEDNIRGSKQYEAYDATKQIYGRNTDREHIISWLLLSTNSRFSLFEDERSRNKFSAISIVGMAGVGKTTLAKEVYNDPLICKYFNSRVWLHFTEESDAVSLSKAFFVSITGKSCDGKEPVHLQSVMKETLKGKKLLLVLDDLQDLNPRLWEYLQAPLTGVRMAKFIITSRTELEASKLRGIESYPLGCLPLDLSWDLFQHCAFREDSSHLHELIEIGKYIVQKCRGLPIAVKTLGSLLGYQMDKRIWIDVLDSGLWELQETETDISPALQLSYYLLPTYLKPCFLYLFSVS